MGRLKKNYVQYNDGYSMYSMCRLESRGNKCKFGPNGRNKRCHLDLKGLLETVLNLRCLSKLTQTQSRVIIGVTWK